MSSSNTDSMVTHPKLLPPSRLPPIQVLLTTETGRHLYHFVHPIPANISQTNTLSAAYAAFSAATSNTVSTITTPSLTILTISKSPLLLAVASQTPNHPVKHLKALAQQTLTTVYTCLSASLIHHLTNFPTCDTTSITARFEPLLNRVIVAALTYPLSPTLSLLPSLPAPLDPAAHKILSDNICRMLTTYKHVSHVLILTASPPYPRRLIASVSPANARLSSLDSLLLMQLQPSRVNDKPLTPELLFLPTCGFRKGFRLALRAVRLQLGSDILDTTHNSISGLNCLSMNVAGDNALCLMALGDWKHGKEDGDNFLNDLESFLDESAVARDVMIGMKRPWKVSDINGTERCSRFVKAVLMLGNERFVGTVHAFGYRTAEAIVRTLDLSSESYISHTVNERLVQICDGRYIVVFDENISKEEARFVMKQVFVPWMKRFASSLMPIDEGTIVQPATPLAGLLAPFTS